MSNVFPSRSTFTFENGLVVTSQFDAGNLLHCTKGEAIEKLSPNKFQDNADYRFNMWVSPDAWPYKTEGNSVGAGFFFAISGFHDLEKQHKDPFRSDISSKIVRFHFKNLNNQEKLLSYGHMPVYLEVDDLTYKKLISGQLSFYRQKWKRLPGECQYFKGDEGLEAIFNLSLRHDLKTNDHIFVAYTYPYTY